MKKHERQEVAYEFLRARGADGEFTLAELVEATGWKTSTAETHVRKHYDDWVVVCGDGVFKVLPEFQRVTKEHFLRHCSQVRRVFTDYVESEYSAISLFEFLLPMSRETQLRATLDDLFYADTLNRRFEELGAERLETLVPREPKETQTAYRSRLLSIVSGWFGGYSISLVNGRFRAASLRTRKDAVQHHIDTDRPYLIDETTASVRFIVPIPASKSSKEDVGTMDLSQSMGAVAADARRVREFFFALFVEAVIRIVNGEDVIWLLEDSPLGRVLHTWEYQGGQ
jgi:hypothetical protein